MPHLFYRLDLQPYTWTRFSRVPGPIFSVLLACLGRNIQKGRNSYAVIPEKIDCDYYRFLQGDPAAVNAFQNDYMAAYSWAEIRNAELGFKMK